MIKHCSAAVFCSLLCIGSGTPVAAQVEPLVLTDSRGDRITFPHGEASFADRVTEYSPGSEIQATASTNPSSATGLPDYSGGLDRTFLSLGCGGSAVWEFTDNVLVDAEGPDLWIFEVGPQVEGATVEISDDGETWLYLGAIEGSTASLDLAGVVEPGSSFPFVRIVDDGEQCSGRTPGADIDTVGAIGSIDPIEPELEQVPVRDVTFPAGDISFLDEMVAYRPGNGVLTAWSDPSLALGAPDFADLETPSALMLGCGGQTVLRFSDNSLINIPGSDLAVFQIAGKADSLVVSISADGVNWLNVEGFEGNPLEVDIDRYVEEGGTFQYVRLTDASTECSGEFPGAMIDAVGAVGSAQRLVLDANLLFDFDSSDIRPEAHQALSEIAASIGSGAIVRAYVDGHTDSRGSDAYNEELSEGRALAVAQQLVAMGVPAEVMTLRAFGESRPVASNDTEEGAQQNRRVEVLLVSH